MKVDVIGSNSLLFANLPPASQVPGRTYRVSNVGPAPGILLTSDGTRYRPAGGRQVLAMRNTPITLQNTTKTLIETIGPFPGGLVRGGMQVRCRSIFDYSAISTATRLSWISVGNTLPLGTGTNNVVNFYSAATNSSNLSRMHEGLFDAINGSTNVRAAPYTVSFDAVGASNILSIDVSLPWYMQIHMNSAAETAVAISSATWAGGIATFNTSAAHTLAVGDKTVTAGVTPTGYNIPAGAIVLSVPTTTQFTVALAADPGAYTSGGTSSRISNVISQSYVLELVG